MADEVEDKVGNALNLVVSTTEQSSNMRKALKQNIFETVSTLRSLFVKLKDSEDRKTSEINKLTKQVGDMETELKRCREKQAKEHRTPSLAGATELDDSGARRLCTPSTASCPEPSEETMRHVALLNYKTSRNFAVSVPESKVKTYKMTVKSRGAHPPDTIKQILKTKINPGEINVGVNTFKLFNGGVLIETNSKEEIEVLDKEIQAKCGDELEANVHMLRKPRLIILNVPEDISTTNIENSILRQNPDLNLKKGSIAAKFTYVKKKMHRNAEVEVGGGGNQKDTTIQQSELGWQICKIEDYLVATRCFKCSNFNHRTQDCRGEVTCPLRAGPHTLKECKGASTTFKCTNCANYNKHNPTKNISVVHSSLDRKYPSLHAVLEKKQTEFRILNGWLADSNR
jgi:hypothetical protein